MIKTLIPYGNAYALVIDKPILGCVYTIDFSGRIASKLSLGG